MGRGHRGAGLSVEFKVRYGPVTIVGCTQTAEGRLKLIVGEGESIPGDTFRIGNTNSRLRFGAPPAEFLERWCAEGPAVAVRLLHAEGGVGKTRLALEWTRRRRAMGWAAGFLPKDVSEDWFERLWMLGQPVLVVLDYA